MDKSKVVRVRIPEKQYKQLPDTDKSEFVREAVALRLDDVWVERGAYDAVGHQHKMAKQDSKMLRWANKQLRGRVRVLSILLLLSLVSVVVLALAVAGTL